MEIQHLRQGFSENAAPIAVLCRHYWILMFACIPLLRVFALTSVDGNFTDWQLSMRIFWTLSLYMEVGVFIYAVINGLNISKAVLSLSPMPKFSIFLWIVALFGSTLMADTAPMLAFRGAGFWIVHILFFTAAAHLFYISNARELEVAERFALTLCAASSAAGIWITVFVFSIGLDSGFDWGINLPGFANLRHTGYFFAPAIAVGVAHLAAQPSKFTITHFGLLIVNIAIMLWLGSRGPVFGLLIGFTFCAIRFSEFRSARFLLKAGVATGIAAMISIILPTPKGHSFGALQRFWSSNSEIGAFSSGRTDFWSEAVELIMMKPLFGYGSHQYQFASEMAGGVYKHPHNSILQFIFDWGLVGGILFIMLLGYAVYMAIWRSRGQRYVQIISAMGLISTLAYSLIDGILFYPYPIAIVIILLLLSMGNRSRA